MSSSWKIQQVVAELAPAGVLRAGINLSNFLLVSGRSESGEPVGIAPDLAAAIANRIDVPVRYVQFESPSDLAASAGENVWDIALIGAEPARARDIAFSSPYVEIESTYLVPAESPLRTISDVDRPGVRIASCGGAAYDLWLDANIRHAQIVKAESLDLSFHRFVDEDLDALAGLLPRLLSDLQTVPGARILEGRFTSVRQAIGTARKNLVGATFLQAFVLDALESGFVNELIKKHQIRGLSVAATPKRRHSHPSQ